MKQTAIRKSKSQNISMAMLRDQILRKTPEARVLRNDEMVSYFKFGFDSLDSLFRTGFPRGQLIELSGDVSSGKTTLLFKILSGVTAAAKALLVDFSGSFFPPAAQAQDIRLSNLMICRPDDLSQGLLITERLIRKKAFGLIVLDLVGQHERPRTTLLQRIRIEAVRSTAQVIFVTDHHPAILPSSLMSLRLTVNRKDDNCSEIHVTKSRVSHEGMRREFRLDGISQSSLYSY